MEPNDQEDIKKKIDEAWKEAVRKDDAAGDKPEQEYPEISFGLFISGMMMETLIALGDLENPITKKKETNLRQARFIIDTLAMLKEKTKGNLTKDEESALDSLVYDLRMRAVNKGNKGPEIK